MRAYKVAYKRSGKVAQLGQLGAQSNLPAIPLDLYDLYGITPIYTTTQINNWLNGIVDLGEPYPAELTLIGHENPDEDSATARQTLFDNYVLVNYNDGFTP